MEQTNTEVTQLEMMPPPLEKNRLKKTSKKERMKLGEQVWRRLESGDYTSLDREELANIFCFIGWIGTQVVSQIVSGKRKLIKTIVKADGLYFDAKQTYDLVLPKVKKSQISSKALSQYSIGPLPKDVSEFYALIARNRNTTINVIFTKVLVQRAKDEQERIESQLQKDTEERRKKLLKDFATEI